MKKIIFALTIALLTCNVAWAQPDSPAAQNSEKRKEKVEALKRTYYSEKLELTPTEAEKFWPIYNEFKKKEDEIRKAGKGEKKKGEEPKLNEKEALAEIEREAQQKKAHVDLETQFLKDAMPILGADRTMKLSKLDRDFQRELVQHMKEKKEGGPKGPKK